MWHGYLHLRDYVEASQTRVGAFCGALWVIFWSLVLFPVISVVNRRVSLFLFESIEDREAMPRREVIYERDKTRRGREDAGRHTKDGSNFEFHTTRHGVFPDK
jgi:hypothetical protein